MVVMGSAHYLTEVNIKPKFNENPLGVNETVLQHPKQK